MNIFFHVNILLTITIMFIFALPITLLKCSCWVLVFSIAVPDFKLKKKIATELISKTSNFTETPHFSSSLSHVLKESFSKKPTCVELVGFHLKFLSNISLEIRMSCDMTDSQLWIAKEIAGSNDDSREWCLRSNSGEKYPKSLIIALQLLIHIYHCMIYRDIR